MTKNVITNLSSLIPRGRRVAFEAGWDGDLPGRILKKKQWRLRIRPKFSFALRMAERYFCPGLSDGVMVAQGPLEAFVMVRIHVGQPILLIKATLPISDTLLTKITSGSRVFSI